MLIAGLPAWPPFGAAVMSVRLYDGISRCQISTRNRWRPEP
jgi:hypothetical protein